MRIFSDTALIGLLNEEAEQLDAMYNSRAKARAALMRKAADRIAELTENSAEYDL